MSRTNHYRLCGCTPAERCAWHIRWDWPEKKKIKPTRAIGARRPWVRKARYPKHSPKQWYNPPPRWWWQEQHSRARAIYREMMRRSDDPALPRECELIDLWGWY